MFYSSPFLSEVVMQLLIKDMLVMTVSELIRPFF